MEQIDEYELKIINLREAFIDGENSGVPIDLDMSSIIKAAKSEI